MLSPILKKKKTPVGGDKSREPKEEDDRHSLMTTPTTTRLTAGEDAEDCEEESSSSHNVSEDGEDGGRILPVLTLAGETGSLHLESRRSEITRALPSYMQWLRTRQFQWHNFQTLLVEEFQIATMSDDDDTNDEHGAARGNY